MRFDDWSSKSRVGEASVASSPHLPDQEGDLSSCRNRIDSIPGPRLALHVLLIEFRYFSATRLSHHRPADINSSRPTPYGYTSRALALAATQPVIGRLLGHSDIETTARNVNLVHGSIPETAERITESITANILQSRCVTEFGSL